MVSGQSPKAAAADVRWLDDNEMATWLLMVEVNTAIQAAIEEDLAPHGLTSGDYGVLARLSASPDHRLRMCDLAEVLHVSPSGLTRRLDGLVRDGFVAREPSADDRRVMLAVLTDDGYKKLQGVAPDHVATVRRQFIDHLSPTQLRNVGAALRAVQVGTDSLRDGR
jgi:DNA-binding MarR family transcriptional regulator